MSNEEKIITKLLNEFSFYNKSGEYYLNIIKNINFENLYELLPKLREIVIDNMTNDWKTGKIDWFCSDIMDSDDLLRTFSQLFKQLENYGLVPNEKIVKIILKKYPSLKEKIMKEFSSFEHFDILEKVDDPLLQDFLTYFYLLVDSDIDLSYIEKYKNNVKYFVDLDAIRSELNHVSGKEHDNLMKKYKLIVEKIVEANIPLVKSIARRYIGNNMDLDDLVQEGCIGVLKAIEKYDVKKECQFSTYATLWIRQMVTRAIGNKSRMIRVPIKSGYLMFKIAQCESKLSDELGRIPTSKEIAKRLQISENQVQALQNIKEPISLNIKVNDDNNTELGDLVENPDVYLPEELVEEKISREEISDFLMALDRRSRKIVMLRSGFFNDCQYSLQQIAEMDGNITRERIRQIENRALNKLKNIKNRKVIVPFSLKKTFLISEDEVIEKASLLLEEDYLFLQRAFGKSLNQDCYDPNKFFGVERIIRNFGVYKDNDKRERGKKMRKRPLLLKDVLEINDIELEEFSLTFDLNHRFYSDLFKVYGSDLQGEENTLNVEKNYLSQIIFKLRQIYASFSKLTEKRVKDYLKYNDKKWNILLNNLDKESEIYQACLPIVGENLDKAIDYKSLTEEQRIILKTFINYLRNLNTTKKENTKNKMVEIISDEEYSKFLTPFRHPFFKEFVKLLPIEYRFITMLRLGLYDDRIYSLKELSTIFNISESEVLLETEKGILLFKNLVQEYEKIYGQKFPELEGESGIILKLLSENRG